jgi:hypothetical protein
MLELQDFSVCLEKFNNRLKPLSTLGFMRQDGWSSEFIMR